jgi:ABC-type transport system involved in multi-copper enzyme maturation permease subunit
VWIALLLLLFCVAWVGLWTRLGLWGMHHWRYPWRNGHTIATWVDEVQIVESVVHRSPGAHGLQHALLGSCRAVLDPQARVNQLNAEGRPAMDPDGRPVLGRVLGVSAFQVFTRSVVFTVFLTFLLPLWSLSFATDALGAEREGNTLVWLLTRPLPRPAIYLAKFVALLPWAVGLNVGGFALICLAAGAPGAVAFRLFWPAVAAGTLAFAALFYLLGAVFRWPAVLAIIYSFCLEVVLGNMPGYLKRVSVGFYARCLMYERSADYGVEPEKLSVFLPVEGATAMTVLLGATAVLLALGAWVFSRLETRETV